MISEETINVWFSFCVWVLDDLAKTLGMSYNAINIWIFCILGPIVFTVLLIFAISQYNYKCYYKNLLRDFTSKKSFP